MVKLQEFYTKLYDKNPNCKSGDWTKYLKQKGLVPQLSEEQCNDLEAPLTRQNLRETVDKCGKNKSTGNDGVTQELYAFFWNSIEDSLY